MQRTLNQIIQVLGRKPRALVVDDDPVTLAIFRAMLAPLVQVDDAATHELALELCRTRTPDLILLDINLGPEEDGFNLCRKIKQEAPLASTPIIFITGSLAEEDEVRAFKLGAVDFIRKPVNPYIAEARVFTHLALKLQSDLLQHVAQTDGLTGLRTRRVFDEELARQWKECARIGEPLSVAMIDVDFFKMYNDTYGHPAGDACLRQVASVIGESLCRPGDCSARYGGEEFACILPRTDFEGALSVAMGIHDRVLALNIPHRHGAAGSQRVSVSVGIATCHPTPHQAPSILLLQADHQLYRAKETGRNRVCGSMQQAAVRVADLAMPAPPLRAAS
jgi:diguanylate cyclase (GGDEF)-like protein